jgi:hypothetical protein
VDNTDALRTHSFSESNPRQIKQDGGSLLLVRCEQCGRDFAQGSNSAGWQAAYVGVFRVEFLARSVNHRWLTEACPGRLVPADDDDRAVPL